MKYQRNLLETVANNVKELRESAGLTQEQLGVAAETNSKTIRNIEKQSNDPKLMTLNKIAKALNVTVNDLLK